MYYLVEAVSKRGLLAGQRTTIGLHAAVELRDYLMASGDYEVNIYSTEVVGVGLIDKKEKLYV